MEDPLHCVMKCHVPHAAAEALRFRSCISFPPPRSVPLPSVRAAAARLSGAAGPFFARVSCVRARAHPRAFCAGAVRAPDCAREGPGEGLPLASLPRTPIRGACRASPAASAGAQVGRFMEDPCDCVMSCHVLHAVTLKLCGSVPAYRSSPLRSVPLPSVRATARPSRSGGTLFARVSCVRARARLRAGVLRRRGSRT